MWQYTAQAHNADNSLAVGITTEMVTAEQQATLCMPSVNVRLHAETLQWVHLYK
jgi:hypothetical protein